MIGVGITPEGIHQNYVLYEFALERGWDQKPTNITMWIQHYTFARYGLRHERISSAWNKLIVSCGQKQKKKSQQ